MRHHFLCFAHHCVPNSIGQNSMRQMKGHTRRQERQRNAARFDLIQSVQLKLWLLIVAFVDLIVMWFVLVNNKAQVSFVSSPSVGCQSKIAANIPQTFCALCYWIFQLVKIKVALLDRIQHYWLRIIFFFSSLFDWILICDASSSFADAFSIFKWSASVR